MSSLPVDAEIPADSPVLRIAPLGFPWPTVDPFLFCVHHDDAYPAANAQNGPAATLAGRDIGQDFSRKDGWSMYHGSTVPGFPAHPHRGFETVTIVRQGLIDHADSLGATARFGRGDVQWLTAGQGVVHSEMFPLLDRDGPNPLELFQIWLNLPASSKMAAPHFTMFWAQDIPKFTATDAEGRTTDVAVIAGRLNDPNARGNAPLPPPPDSWAAQPEADVAIWTLRMAPGARWTLPAAVGENTRRQLYFFKGDSVSVAGQVCDLTSYQFDLLVALAERAGRVLTRDQIMEAVRGRELDAFDRSIDVHMGRIRAAIELDAKSPKRILTVRGVGYVFARQQD